MKNYVKQFVSVAACGLAAACATTHPVPTELADARAAYGHATSSEGATLAQAQMHVAKTALEAAEKQFSADAENPKTRDLAYIAARKAELAEAVGDMARLEEQQKEGEKAIGQYQVASGEQKDRELTSVKKDLASAQLQAKDALLQLTSLRDKVKQDERGLVITLSGNVLFGSNKTELLPAARTQLDDIVRALVGAKDQAIIIEGFTDATGATERNEELSKHRAEAVMNYFAEKGLALERMRAVGRGPSNPIADNKSAEGRATNRRVEIVVQAQGAASR